MPAPVAQNPHASGMEAHLAHVRALPADYWWHDHRYRLVASLLGGDASPLLDFGCGTGDFLRFLAGHDASGRRLCGFDPSPEAAKALASSGPRVERLAQMPHARLFGVITALDVLEHVENDSGAVKALKACLVPGGRVIVTVPAMSALWSRWDVDLGHHRRYSRESLAKLLAEEGLTVDRVTYFFSYLIAPALWRHWRHPALPGARPAAAPSPDLEFRPVAAPVDAALKFLAARERAWLGRWNVPFGTSLLAVATWRP